MKRKIIFLLILAGIQLFWGCYPEGPEYLEDYDVVITHRNDNYNFSGKFKFAMPDKIVKITGLPEPDPNSEFIPDDIADQILARISMNMEEKGFQKVELNSNAKPDLVLIPAAIETTTILYWYDFWYWWWGDYYPGWGWNNFYPGWWSSPGYISSYSTGTLLMLLIDPDKSSALGDPIPQWTGAINGLLTTTYSSSRVNTAIDKAFYQSPYLNPKPKK